MDGHLDSPKTLLVTRGTVDMEKLRKHLMGGDRCSERYCRRAHCRGDAEDFLYLSLSNGHPHDRYFKARPAQEGIEKQRFSNRRFGFRTAGWRKQAVGRKNGGFVRSNPVFSRFSRVYYTKIYLRGRHRKAKWGAIL